MAFLEREMRFFSKPDSKEDDVISFLKGDSPAGTVYDASTKSVSHQNENKKVLKVKDINAFTASVLEKEMEKEDKLKKERISVQRRPLVQLIASAFGKS